MERTTERLLACVVDAANACGRPLDVGIRGALSDEMFGALLSSGAVRRVVAEGMPANFLVVVLADETPFDDAGYLAGAGAVLFDPRAIAPVAAKRLAQRAWAGVQTWVLPIEGPDAFTEGIIFTASELRSSIPQFSCSMPVNLEVHDVERVLASFLPIAAEWVVGVDEKSNDGTLAIVERYADVLFRFRIEPWSFAAARNATVDRCAFPWIFQTEGHEHLAPESIGQLRVVGGFRLPRGILMVPRHIQAGENGQFDQIFSFPWVFRNHPALRFSDQNGVHNALEMAKYAEAIGARDAIIVRGPDSIHTVHRAHPENRTARHVQAKEMNRTALETFAEGATGSAAARARFYAMQEHHRAGDLRAAIRAGFEYLRTKDPFSEQNYEGHIMLGEMLLCLPKPKIRAAIAVLRAALPLDLHRVEAEILLGDAFRFLKDYESARQCYAKATGVPPPAYSNLFVRRRCYEGMPWIGLAVTLYAMQDYVQAREAARMALHFEPGNETCQNIAGIVLEGEEAAA